MRIVLSLILALGPLLALGPVLALGLAACSYPTSQTYRASETGRKLEVEYATVISSRAVTVIEDPDAKKNWYGPIAGATVGGVSASAGGASDAIVIGAAVIGLGLGFLIEEMADTRKGHEYILRDEKTGEEFALVVQAVSDAEPIPPGTRIRIVGTGSYRRVER
jgi:outer membrane lipoprotein SlyB